MSGRTVPGTAGRRGMAAAGGAAVILLLALVPVAPASAMDDMPGDGEAKWIVQAWCSACHSLNMVLQQGMSRRRWDETLTWMVEKQGMPVLPDDTRETVLDYLAEHFGEDHRPANAPTAPGSFGAGMAPLLPPQ